MSQGSDSLGRSPLLRALIAVTGFFALGLALACGAQKTLQAPATAASTQGAGGSPTAVSSLPKILPKRWSAVTADGIEAILATVDLSQGPQRFAFVLSDGSGLIRLPVVQTRLYRYSGGFETGAREGPLAEVTARFHEFPLGTRGIYVTRLEFAGAGDWALVADVPRPDGSVSKAEIRFEVGLTSESVAVGSSAPPSRNRTLRDVPSIAYLTTGTHRDPYLYQTTVADAIRSGQPTIVVFASPAFCTNAVCGPQVEVLSEVRQEYGDRANYVHIDYYQNPQEIQGSLDRAVLSPHLAEWGLGSQEWTFVMARDGTVAAKFENFATREEIKAVLDAVLAAG